ncbi:hypothetical protein J2Y63_002927 [Shinella sp. BE166]|uniref:hypothetical protein n=1 Tax=Shinella sp. BE166 TaxID=3373918 RepID=UPI003EBF73B2
MDEPRHREKRLDPQNSKGLNSMMFAAIDWPPTCYIQEGAYWRALGRVPRFYYGDEDVDGRLDEESKWSGDVPIYDCGFSESEFAWIGHRLDYKRYENAPTASDEEFVKRILESPPLEGESVEEREAWRKETREKFEAERLEAAWHDEQERAFDACVDDARAEIYRSLSKGDLKAIGWLRFPEGERSKDGPFGRFVDIEPRRWSLRHFDWEKSTLRSNADEFLAVQIKTQNLLALFPKPAIEPLTYTVLAYPHGLLISDDMPEGAHSLPRPPGRSAKAGGVIRSVVQNYFGYRLRKGESIKGEALIQEVIDFVAVTFPGEKISRSTAQEYLKGARPTGV